MKQILILLLFFFSFGFSFWSAKCPSWELGTYTHHQCVSYGERNFYVAGGNAQFAPQGDQIQAPGQPLSNGTSKDPYDSYYGWWYCDSLPDSARIAICEKDFVYCADESSGHFFRDTVVVYDTLVKVDTIRRQDTLVAIDTIRSVYTRVDTLLDTLIKIDTLTRIDTVVHIFTDTIVRHDTAHVPVDVYDTTHVPVVLYDTTHYNIDKYDTSHTAVDIYDTTHTPVAIFDTNRTLVSVYDTTIVPLTLLDTTWMFDTTIVDVYDTIVNKIILHDTLYKTLEDTMYITIDLPKIAALTQDKLTESPKIRIKLDSTLYNLNRTDVVTIRWHYRVFDNFGSFVSEKEGTDTVYVDGHYYDYEYDIFNVGLTSDSGRRLGTGVYIIRGSYVVFLNNSLQYREFELNKYGLKRND